MKVKKIVVTCLVLTIFSIILMNTSAFASGLGKGFDYDVIPKEEGSPVFEKQTNKIWNTVVIVVRLLAFIGIFAVGLRYMFASPNQKGELKRNSIALVIGMILVFTSTSRLVIDFVVTVFTELTS